MALKTRLARSLLAATLVTVIAVPHSWSQQHHASTDQNNGRIGDQWVEATWPVEHGSPAALVVRDLRDGHTLRLDGPFRIALEKGGIVEPTKMKLLAPARTEDLAARPGASVAAERLPGTAIHYRLGDPDGRFEVDWSVVMREGAHYVRQVLAITAGKQDVGITSVSLVDATAPGMRLTGTVKGSPLTAGNFYLGFEHPISTSSVVHERGTAEIERVLPLRAGQTVTYSAVVGVAGPGQMRRDFLAYIERERAHPYRTFLHYNSWYDIGYENPYTQAQSVERINTFGQELHVKRGVNLDSFMFDDGWDDRQGMWAIRKDFKDGFLPLQDAAAKYDTAPGVWLSPWGGYAEAKQERIAEGRKEGYEIENGGFALSGPKYYARFHEICMEMLKKYGVNQFKFDGTGNADTVFKGSVFDSDFDAAIHLIGDLRQV
ncbi:MAG TPA: enterotoxin, partial [Acidobacteriaceae bacterium]